MEGDVNSSNLLNNLEDNSRRGSERFTIGFGSFRDRFFSRDVEVENEIRTERFSNEIYAYCLLVFVIFIVLGLNFIPITETLNQVNESVIFSTYYTSKYNLCLTYSDKNNAVNTGEMASSEKECIDGDVDITLFYKDVSLEDYYRVYAVFSFQLDYQGDWYVPWKKKHFFSSKKKDKRLVIGLSNLIQQDGMFRPFNTKEISIATSANKSGLRHTDINKVSTGTGNKDATGKNGSLTKEETGSNGSMSGEVKTDSISDNSEKVGKVMMGDTSIEDTSNNGVEMVSGSEGVLKPGSGGDADFTSYPDSNNDESEEYSEMIKKELEEFLSQEFADEVDSNSGRNEDVTLSAGTGSDSYVVFSTGVDNEVNGSSGVTLYLNSFVPNFINVKNVSSKLFKGVINGDSSYSIYKEGNSLLNSIRLNTWNEFSSQFNVYNYNLQVNLHKNPMEYYYANRARVGDRSSVSAKNGSEKTKNGVNSFRKLDDFYLLNLKKFVQNEYQHISNFDTSILNIFNVFKTKNPYRRFFKKKSKEKTTKGTGMKENKALTDEEEGILDQEVLNKYFGPMDWSTNREAGKTTNVTTGGESSAVGGSGVSNTDIDGVMWCNDMNIDLSFKGKEKNFRTLKTSVKVFSMLFLTKAISEIGLIWRQFGVVESAGQGRTVSLISLSLLSFQDVLDLFLLLYHSNLFLNVAFVFVLMLISKFVIICILHQNFIVLVWRASHSHHIRRGWIQTQKSFLLFYKYYFTFMGILVIILYFFYEVFPFIIALSFWSWLPQILLDVWRGQNNSLSMTFIFFSIALKMFFPIYLFFTPTNMFNSDKFSSDYLGHNRNLVYFITFIISLQLILISIQRLKGPRCFASWSILPKIYSYVRPWSKMMQDDDQECVICMYDIVQSNRDWCLTPCDHLFHTKCLKDWTTIKLECPNCRREIPPITE